MTAHHFFAPPEAIDDRFVTLTGAEAQHAGRSLRLRVGEVITVADGSGRVVTAEVASVEGDVRAEIVAVRRVTPARPEMILVQALTKGEKFDDVVEKASELGVSRIAPFVAERSVVRWDDDKCSRAQERWRAIARSAAKQSRSPWICIVDSIVDSPPLLVAPTIALHEDATDRLRESLPEVAPASIGIVVGPEGGLTDDEIAMLVSRGASAVSLGSRVLRTETAGMVAASMISYRYGTMG